MCLQASKHQGINTNVSFTCKKWNVLLSFTEEERKKEIYFPAYIKKKENKFLDLKILPKAACIHVKKYSHIKLRSQVKY